MHRILIVFKYYLDEYPEAAHEPPLSTKPVPLEINLYAVSFLHFGQKSTGGAVIDCSSSHS